MNTVNIPCVVNKVENALTFSVSDVNIFGFEYAEPMFRIGVAKLGAIEIKNSAMSDILDLFDVVGVEIPVEKSDNVNIKDAFITVNSDTITIFSKKNSTFSVDVNKNTFKKIAEKLAC